MKIEEMELRHYSGEKFEKAVFHMTAPGQFFKPNGLWLSVENANRSWKDWCIAEQFRLEDLKYAYEVRLWPGANILLLDTERKVMQFTKDFPAPKKLLYDLNYIDWFSVQGVYDGVICSPYLYSLRFDLSWYDGWDCASGCIWRERAIESFELLEEIDTKKLIQEAV